MHLSKLLLTIFLGFILISLRAYIGFSFRELELRDTRKSNLKFLMKRFNDPSDFQFDICTIEFKIAISLVSPTCYTNLVIKFFD